MNNQIDKLELSSDSPNQTLIKTYTETGIVKVPCALSNDSAGQIYSALEQQAAWNLVFNHAGKHQDLNAQEVQNWSEQQKSDLQTIIYSQATNDFQYCYENIPLYDIYHDNLLPGHFFNRLYEFLNAPSTLNYFRELLSEPEITFLDAQITRFSAGHFLTTHNDQVAGKNRVAAYVINLTPEWRADWGGALHILDAEKQIKKSFLPSFNEINIFKIPVEHYVGYVSPFATGKRISITGWLRTGNNPKNKKE